MKIKWLLGSLSLACVAACSSTGSNSDTNINNQISTSEAPKNIIMVVADGMGPAFVTAYRNYMDDPTTTEVEPIVLDDILVGTSRTYPHQVSGFITDSAASATALSSGIKTYNGAIGMDVNKQPVKTVLHQARDFGMKTGLAVTSTIVHATPASYMVANEQRRNYNQIADSFFDDRINGDFLADVMLGAGQSQFIREDRNLVNEFTANGFQYVDTYAALESADRSMPILGLFGATALPWALDDVTPTRLSLMTKSALEHLENPQGFFLLVEASQVDWAGHSNDIASAMAEMHDFAVTIDLLKDYVAQHPDTLVVITADHSTGGLTVAASDGYRWDPQFIKSINRSVEAMAVDVVNTDDKVSMLNEELGFLLNSEEENLLSLINADSSVDEVVALIKRIIDQRTNTGWTTTGHTGVDVNIYAFGPQSQRFEGNMDNTEIAKKLFSIIDEANQ